jgi:hypothetical protein
MAVPLLIKSLQKRNGFEILLAGLTDKTILSVEVGAPEGNQLLALETSPLT